MNVKQARTIIDQIFASSTPELALAQLQLIAQHVENYIAVLDRDPDGEPVAMFLRAA
jgi:hypothetical protein